ncbi:2355_t:CDS:2 [Ambispora leptoticha]|uniref:2355_t:CDS:1 n=1 Tax=Ambispora leptoticha TaxID=144679 RepID=A0A9N8WAD7_9GLOM|nr:2355_t:CDS:2 [Ambispora leptoticha]
MIKQPLEILEKFKLVNGTIISKYSIEQSIDTAICSPKPIIKYMKSQNIKISHSSKICDSFMLSSGLEIDENSVEDLKKFFMLFNMNYRKYSENPILNDLETYDVYCEITSEQASIEYSIQSIKITTELKDDIEEALESNTPIEDLKNVFDKFGHIFTTKIIIGDKLQRIVRFNREKNKNENESPIYLSEFNVTDNDLLENEILNRWKEEIHPHDPLYLWMSNGDPIEISQIPKWLDTIPLFETEWHIIKRIVIPMYKILDINQQKKIERLFSKQDHILMTGTTTILAINTETGYQRITFDNGLKSSNYQIFGKVVDVNGQIIPNFYVKFCLKSEYGFSIDWIRTNSKSLQTSYELKWLLIGCPSEIGYFDSTTRDKEIKTGSTELKITSKKKAALENEEITQQWSCRINVDKSLSPTSVVSFNVEYPTTRKTPTFTASYQISQGSIIEVKVEPIKDEYVECLNENDEITVTIQCDFIMDRDIVNTGKTVLSIIYKVKGQKFDYVFVNRVVKIVRVTLKD